ncbi:hypothetical protein [Streptosporangium canum]|uniref:hypothetical protein n=1 Tax=Streptosporangium canum TaxID=324952 RepID=UPI0037A5B4B2
MTPTRAPGPHPRSRARHQGKNTSRSGNCYHNKRFAALAAELGLPLPTTPTDHHEFSECLLGDATAAAYAETITHLTAAIIAYLPDWSGDLLTVGTTGTEADEEQRNSRWR